MFLYDIIYNSILIPAPLVFIMSTKLIWYVFQGGFFLLTKEAFSYNQNKLK